MNGAGVLRTIFNDGDFASAEEGRRIRFSVVNIPYTSSVRNRVVPSQSFFEGLTRQHEATPGGITVLFIPQKRIFLHEDTKCRIDTDIDTWLGVLQHAQIPPNAVELLHENNGGYWEHTSYCGDNSKQSCTGASDQNSRCAYHVCVKLCEWGNYEHYFYARYDFHTDSNFVLVMGTGTEAQVEGLCSQFESLTDADIFSILLNLLNTWTEEVEAYRWRLDYSVQNIESKTGYASLQFEGIVPLPPEKLMLQKNMAIVRDSLHGTHRASSHMEEIFGCLNMCLERYQNLLQIQDPDLAEKKLRLAGQLRSAIKQNESQQNAQAAQINLLIGRVDAQWNNVTTMVAQHNNELNLVMAKDTRRDSVLMRRIAAVTTVFLPATFMATFFSMIFFHSEGDRKLRADSTIWVYFVCTTALSLIIVFMFEPRVMLRRVVNRLSSFFGKKATGDAEKGKMM